MKTSTSILFFISIFVTQLSAQFPANYEFLEHRHFRCSPGALKVHNNDIYYASHNSAKPMTLVNRVTADKEFEVLLKLKHESAKSKLFEISDSSFQIVLYDLFDYDIPFPGMYVVNVEGSSYTVDTLFQVDEFGFNQDHIILNIEKDKNGNWITFGRDSIYSFNKTGILSSEPTTISQNVKSFSNAAGDLFILEQKWNANETILHGYQNGTINQIATIRNSGNLNVLATGSQGVYLSNGNDLLRFSSDDLLLTDFWDLNTFQGEIRKINLHNNKVELLSQSNFQYHLYRLNGGNDIQLLHEELLNKGEEILNFQDLGSDQYLFTGTYELENITRNVFFRNINIIDNSSTIYPKVDISVIDLEVVHTHKDTFDTNVTAQGDTVHSIQYHYDFSARLVNGSFIHYHITTGFTQDLAPFSGIKTPLAIELDSFPSASTMTVNEKINSLYRPFSELTIVIPGANYMFNDSDEKIKTTEPITATKNLLETEWLSILPHPATEFLYLRTTRTISAVTIYDNVGYPVYFSTKSQKEIPISSLSSGNYFIAIKAKGQDNPMVSKFVKI